MQLIIGHLVNEFRIVADHQDRGSARCKRADVSGDGVEVPIIHPGGRFVKDIKVGVCHRCIGDDEALLLPAR